MNNQRSFNLFGSIILLILNGYLGIILGTYGDLNSSLVEVIGWIIGITILINFFVIIDCFCRRFL